MTGPELVELLAVLERVARQAGALVLTGYRRGSPVHKKGAIDLVTEYDLASQELIVAALGRELPGLAIVAEEGAQRVAPADELACYVDPIDGTTNFAHGHPFFGVSLGLARGGEPLAGVVFAPALDVCWTGIAGRSATRNGVPCAVASRARVLGDALIATGFGYDVVGTADDNVAEFRAVQASARAVRRCGAAALDLAMVADGTYDAYWEWLLQPWDLAAGAALVLAAGGQATDFDGAPLDVRRGAVIASSGLVHDELRALIRATRDGLPVPSRRL
jgi:myo-inositol-1(or 4)-monophosphatase